MATIQLALVSVVVFELLCAWVGEVAEAAEIETKGPRWLLELFSGQRFLWV